MHAPQKYVDRFPELAWERRIYAAMIAAVDDGIGQIIDTLRRVNQLENTMIFWLSDNGATTEKRAGLNQQFATAGSNEPFRGFKFSLFDGGIHVPAIVSWPGKIAAGQTNSQVVMSMDIFPKVCEAAGITLSNHSIDGKSILPILLHGENSPHDAIFWKQGDQKAVRRGPWKLVVNGILADRSEEGRKPLTGEDALFLSNLEEDPGESRNLRRKYPKLVDELLTLLSQWEINVAKSAE